jgi:DNA polymerase III subunit epsilon
MFLLGVDFETTGLDLENDLIIEGAGVVWDTGRDSPIDFYSGFANYPEMFDPLYELKPEITEITGIDADLLRMAGWPAHGKGSPLHRILHMAHKYNCEYIVAHNARGFDRPMYRSNLVRAGHEAAHLDKFKWIDTRTDVPYHKSITTRNLKYLLADHGIINPFPHRALTDTLSMMTLLSEYDIDEVILISQTPNLKILANVSYDNRQQAKDRSFHWDPKTSSWFKLIKKNLLGEEEKLCPFRIKVIEEIAP